MRSTTILLALVTSLAGNAYAQNRPALKPLDAKDREFLGKARGSSMYLIALSKAVQDRVTNPRVKQLATNIQTEHRKAVATLTDMLRDRGVEISDALNQRRTTRIGNLTKMTPDQLAAEYTRLMIARLQPDVNMYSNIVKQGKDRVVVSFASGRMPALQQQLKQIRDARTSLHPVHG